MDNPIENIIGFSFGHLRRMHVHSTRLDLSEIGREIMKDLELAGYKIVKNEVAKQDAKEHIDKEHLTKEQT